MRSIAHLQTVTGHYKSTGVDLEHMMHVIKQTFYQRTCTMTVCQMFSTLAAQFIKLAAKRPKGALIGLGLDLKCINYTLGTV